MKDRLSFLHVMLAAMLLFPGSQRASAGHDAGRRVVFLSNRVGVSRMFDIFLRDSTGSEVNVNANHPGLGITSLSAPKLLGTRESVVCFGSGGKTLLEIPLGAGAVKVLAKLTQASGQISIAPDEQALLYTDRVNGKSQVFEADLRQGSARNLSSNPWNNSEASYSRDGSWIVFVSDKDSSLSIGVMKRNGGSQRILTNNFGDDRFPHFSPEGERIVFTSSRSGVHDGQYDLYTIDTSGSRFELLYSNGAYNTSPIFSPDGKEIMFLSSNFTKKVSHVLLLNCASGSVNIVTGALSFLSQNASFSNNGQLILFEHNTIRDCEIMLYDRQTKSMEDLTQNPSWDCSPSF
ncbi:MAG: translocation protein TolB [Bacteroidetes bacterium]|nr:translocation protein TolB [Bacteroidota bacterium]